MIKLSASRRNIMKSIFNAIASDENEVIAKIESLKEWSEKNKIALVVSVQYEDGTFRNVIIH